MGLADFPDAAESDCWRRGSGASVINTGAIIARQLRGARDHVWGEVVGQNVEAHLGSDLVEGPGQEVGGAHPRLEGAERVFDGLSSHAHGVGHAVEPGLHPVEHVLILPALDNPQLGRRALGSERTGEAGAQVAVAVEVFCVIRAPMDLGEFCARRACVVVVLGVG